MKIPEKNAEQTSNDFQKGFNVGMQMNYMESTKENKTDWESRESEVVKLLCEIRKGAMDDKQFKATAEYNIHTLLAEQREEILTKLLSDFEKLPPDERDWKEHIISIINN